ncbi:MAG TPA: peptidoglycan glycosyltransferase [Lachnospiraceae bacterium]|nr:peptidoglycan glycosyltransferase [Lachnospiraceae bacterium]
MARKVSDTRGNVRLAKKFMYARLLFIFILVLLAFTALVVRIVYLNGKKGDAYEKKVLAQQSYVSNVVQFKRGDITDRNGNKLATSVKFYNLILDPKLILSDEKYIEPTIEALGKVFGISRKKVENILQKNPSTHYYVMDKFKHLSSKKVDELEKLQDYENIKDKEQRENSKNIKGIWFEEEYIRNYPYSEVACDVIGFCNSNDDGAWGIERQYNSSLTGSSGRQYGYFDSGLNLVQTVKPAVDGNTVVSTIDINIQGILEQHIEKFQKNTGSKNIGCIMMNPNNGEIYAMASYPSYDLNNPRDLSEFYSKKQLARMSEEKKLESLNSLWRNYCISDAYEPGSTLKPVTVAAALDEGVTADGSYYNCDGAQQVADRRIKCVAHARGGHGYTNICQALKWSCNDVLMQLGAKLGKTRFLEYINNFGFGQKTGIDLPGEGTGAIFNENTMGPVQLATSSFGQSQTVTMVQMAAAFSAVVNGGNYYQPHVVKEIDTKSGAVVSSNDNMLVRRIITEDTSKLLRQYLYKTVSDEDGTAKPARVDGYKIGGKTGTAEKQPRGRGNYLVSFIGCTPADNPEVVIYVIIDEPNVEDQSHASVYATQFASGVMKDVLPFLGIYPDKSSAKTKKSKTSKNKIKLPSTKDGVFIDAPEGGFSNKDYDIAGQ